jgi:predicted aminopeptidase
MRLGSLVAGLGLAAALLAGCESLDYYGQAVQGHFDLMASRQPIDALLADPSADLRDRLARVLEIREFASEALALPDNRSYRSVVPTPSEGVVWSVVATPPYSLEPREWCFPIAGCTTYRGYFDRARADAYAAALAAEGLDVTVDSVPAYSTLGWFDDPVPGGILRWPDHDLAAIVFHELAHQRFYLKGDSAFNEAFATAVAEEGVERWLAQRGDAAAIEDWRGAQSRRRAFLDLLLEIRAGLATLYSAGFPEAEMQEGKERLFDELRERYADLEASWGGVAGFGHWMARPLNNARLAAVATYREQLPAFRALLQCVGGDLTAFYEAVERLAKLPQAERDAARSAACRGPAMRAVGVHDALGHAVNTSL